LAEFLAIHQSDASLLGCLLRRLAGRVSLGHSERAAGVGFFQSDDLLLRKRPLGGQAALPEKLAEGVESEAALICSGAVGSTARSFHEQMTLPFRFKHWLFATAGQPDTLAPVRAALLKNLPDYLRRSVKGDSAAEALFFTFLSRLRDVGRLDDHDLDASTAARSLAAAVGETERAFEQMGQPLPGMALVVSNGRVMAALRRGHPLSVGLVDGLTTCSRCEIGPAANELNPRVKSHRMLRAAMVLSGAAAPIDGFRDVAEREVIAIPRTLTEIRSL
jgi:glutamine amidotransferase